MGSFLRAAGARLRRALGRIRVRLLVVMLGVLIVPFAGLEFARVYERQLLNALQRDMRDQAVLVARLCEERHRERVDGHTASGAPAEPDARTAGATEDPVMEDPVIERVVARAALATRTRVRVLTVDRRVAVDSHHGGPPEGPEPPPPSLASSYGVSTRPLDGRDAGGARSSWREVFARTEVVDAFGGRPSAYTRVRARHPEVLLFVTEPVRIDGEVPAVVYVTRSTQPVLVELYRIRTGLVRVLAVAFVFCLVVTLALAWSISRPLSKLSRAASRIAHGERDVSVPVGGSGEVRELGEAFVAMAAQLDARAQSMRDFAADVAHEFKSPLTSIRGAAELLREAAADDPPARDRFLGNIELDAERLDRLVTRLLELSRLEASTDTMTTVDLETLVRRVADRASDDRVSVALDYRASKRLVRARAPDLERAIQNVVDNAVRFSPAGAVVAIRVDDRVQRPGGARSLVVSVIDEGPGIADENLGRIFDRFFTTDADRNGTGLGLAIVRAVMDAHGGRVWAESALGSGTTVHLEMPVA